MKTEPPWQSSLGVCAYYELLRSTLLLKSRGVEGGRLQGGDSTERCDGCRVCQSGLLMACPFLSDSVLQDITLLPVPRANSF